MMDTQQQSTQIVSDDQELSKVLAGISKDSMNNLNFEETPVDPSISESDFGIISESTQPPVAEYNPLPDVEESPEPTQTPDVDYSPKIDLPASDATLEDIKVKAIKDLRPLVEKLDLNPEDKFNIYLLILRSTDDKSLIAPAYAAARNITDETKRAQALLDIIKEIDFLSAQL